MIPLRRSPAWIPFGVLAASQIAIPLADDPDLIAVLTTVVVVAFWATTLVLAAGSWGLRRAGLAATFVGLATLGVEKLGTTTGFPFGEYAYTGELQPAIGGVPAIVPLAWFAMGVPALEVARRIVGGRWAAVVVAALALTAWDLFLDPQMVGEGYWAWAVDGVYRGIPLSNYAGWVLTGLVVLAVVDRIRPDGAPVSDGLLGLYTWWTVMSTIGFAVFFDDLVVAAVGGAGMGAITALAWRSRAGSDRMPTSSATT